MNLRMFFILVIFLLMPLAGLVLVALSKDYTLTSWDYLELTLSLLFSLTLMFRYYKWAKAFVRGLFISILLREGIELYQTMHSTFFSITSFSISMIFTLLIVGVIYYFLIIPAFDNKQCES
jgi:hypothetical protein